MDRSIKDLVSAMRTKMVFADMREPLDNDEFNFLLKQQIDCNLICYDYRLAAEYIIKNGYPDYFKETPTLVPINDIKSQALSTSEIKELRMGITNKLKKENNDVGVPEIDIIIYLASKFNQKDILNELSELKESCDI